jgi:hypothetical protein
MALSKEVVMKKALIAAAVSAVLVSPAMAATLFTEDFESSTVSTPTLGGWNVVGTPELLYGYHSPFASAALDLVASGVTSGGIIRSFNTVAGMQYSVSFDYALATTADTVNFSPRLLVGFGPGLQQYVPLTTGISTGSMMFTATQSGQALLSFFTFGFQPAKGPIIDNISVSAVPEPSALALAVAGFGVLGLMARRRRAS